MRNRKTASRPGAFRPAAQVAADLLRQVTPKRQRVPCRPVPGVEIHDVRVTTARHHNGSPVATVALTASDAIRVTVAAREYTCRGKRKADADAMLPVTMTDDGPVLAVQLDSLPNGLTPGAVVRVLRIGFGIDAMSDAPAVIAIAEKVILAEAEIVAAPVSLAPATVTGGLTDTDVGLPEDPVAQLRAETFLKAAIAYKMREADLARQLARAAALAVPANVPVVHVEVPDEAMMLVDPTDRLSPDDAVILRELRRIAGRPRGDDRGTAVS